MAKIRIGKDISVRWSILTNGEAVPLEGRDLKLIQNLPNKSGAIEIPFTTEENTIVFSHYGKNQTKLGKYTYTLWENYGNINQSVVDSCDGYTLVSTTCMEDDVIEDVSNLETKAITLSTSDMNIGVKGASAYEIAVDKGFVGTEEEWLASLKGKPFTYEDFTEEQIAELQKPALDAAERANAAAESVEGLVSKVEQAVTSAEQAATSAT